MYTNVQMKLSETQLRKVKSAIEEKTGTVIQITRDNLVTDLSGDYNITVPLTKTQVEKLDKLTDNGIRLKLSKTQLSSGSNTSVTSTSKASDVELVVTPAEKKKINTELLKLLSLKEHEEKLEQDGAGIGSLFKLALPFVKKVLPKIAASLGLAAASGAISGATHKATSGRGIKVNRKDLEEIMKLGNACQCHKTVPSNFVDKMNRDVQEQRGGFLGTLLAGLAGSILPSLLGKGIKRASGIRRANGIKRATGIKRASGINRAGQRAE